MRRKMRCSKLFRDLQLQDVFEKPALGRANRVPVVLRRRLQVQLHVENCRHVSQGAFVILSLEPNVFLRRSFVVPRKLVELP